jgi:hypothetical protein
MTFVFTLFSYYIINLLYNNYTFVSCYNIVNYN